ncbi:ATP-dependent protease HslVU (ClpYQ), peptidase subunit [Variovorax sp. CF079]|jgi:ATP-dependent HslUV protease subunit HslV|uniref:MFS transporter n=1 Tax=Variovorax sp. CF079 TaxID=1882774 RepID=UPI00088FE238|nr:MFS transporter [Variovorax sp. CF079]SDD55285.1 ATP-dependent protease HslVU (ClpYQ), peptidase subunit [Variovorax sp. CF079]
MTTVVAVRKGGQVVMAADALVTFGDTRLSFNAEANQKLFRVADAEGESVFAVAGAAAHFLVLQQALAAQPADALRFGSKDQIFRTFTLLHPVLKESFFLQTKEDEHDPYESSQFTMLLANPSGIYGIYSYREVFEFKQFWSIGSGRSFALGAMHAAYDKARSAREIAEAGVAAACEFDRNSAGPIDVLTLKLKVSK